MNKLKLKEDVFQVGYDLAYQDCVSCLIVGKILEDKFYAKSFYNKDADFLYDILTGEKTINEAIYDRCEKEYKENGW